MFDSVMKFRKVWKTIFTNFDKIVQFIKIQAECSFWKNLRKFQEKFKGNFNNCWKNFQEIFVINKIRANFKYSLPCSWENFVVILRKWNFYEIREKFKSVEKILRKLKKKIDQFQILAEISKKICHFRENFM